MSPKQVILGTKCLWFRTQGKGLKQVSFSTKLSAGPSLDLHTCKCPCFRQEKVRRGQFHAPFSLTARNMNAFASGDRIRWRLFCFKIYMYKVINVVSKKLFFFHLWLYRNQVIMCPRTKALRHCVPRTMRLLEDASPGRWSRCVPWTMHPLDDASLERCVPWTMHPLDEASLWRFVPWMMRPCRTCPDPGLPTSGA